MKRLTLLLTLAAVAYVSTPAQASDLSEFINRWKNSQREYERRYDRWEQYQTNRYPVPNQPPVIVPPQQAPGVLPQVISITQEMQPYVSAVSASLVQVQDERLRNAASHAEEEIRSINVSARRGDQRGVEEHHEHFDEEWQQVVFLLKGYQTSSRMQQYLNTTEALDRRLHQLLHNGFRPEFAQGRVLQLTQRLVVATSNLQAVITSESDDWQIRSILYQARRTNQLASDLSGIATAGARHSLLVDEFKQFDNSWHKLNDRIRSFGYTAPELASAAADVRRIDRELHQALLVEAPVVDDQNSFNAMLRRTRHATDELIEQVSARMMNSGERIGQRRLTGSLYRFRDELDNFSQLSDAQKTSQSWAAVQSSWGEMEQIYQQIPSNKVPEIVSSYYADLSNDYRFLDRKFDGQPDWRYRR